MKDRSYAEDLVARATTAGCTTLVLTVDLAVTGRRYRDVRNGLTGEVSRVRQLRRGLDFDLPAGLFDKAVDHAQPQAGALWEPGTGPARG